MIQVRNVPEELHRVLKTRAAKDGRTLSDWCLAELRRSIEQPTWSEMRERLSQLPSLGLHDVGAAELIREERDRR